MNGTLLIIVKIATFLVMIGSCAIFFLLLQRIGKSTGNVSVRAQKGIDNVIKKNGGLGAYKRKLSKNGVMYRAGDYNLNPSWYVMVRAAIGVLCSLLAYGLVGKNPAIILGIPIGYLLTGFYFSRKNAEDNKAIMMDLYNTYANLKIQMESGIYIVESLEYVHKVAQNKRYRDALGELIINFSDKTIPMSDAVDIFKDRFDSREIDKLCALLHSCILYGTQAAYTKDIMGEIQSIMRATTMEAEHDIESMADAIRFAFFAIIIFLSVYAVFMGFSDLKIF